MNIRYLAASFAAALLLSTGTQVAASDRFAEQHRYAGVSQRNASTPAAGQTLSVLYSFTGADGFPFGDPLAVNGAGYGTTASGGNPCTAYESPMGCGSVFQLTPPHAGDRDWKKTTILAFTGADGYFPTGGLVALGGSLYGTTSSGANLACSCGTVFKLTPPAPGQSAWIETVLHVFTGGSDGGAPSAGLIADADGALYGTTVRGGNTTASCARAGCGTVFKLTPPVRGSDRWTHSVLYAFNGLGNGAGTDGSAPVAGLTFDPRAGAGLYGTTILGGAASCHCGTIFRLTPNAAGHWTESILHSFTGFDGSSPNGLIADKRGAVYGTTSLGGRSNDGIVFTLTPPGLGTTAWTSRVLHVFTGADGASPIGTLVANANGDLYGTTLDGGVAGCLTNLGSGCGTVFKLVPPLAGGAWTQTVLQYFTHAIGTKPSAALLDIGGTLYGTTTTGGRFGNGSAFQLEE